MDFKNEFKSLYNASKRSAMKKALMFSVFLSFSVLFITSLVFWIASVKMFWIAFIVFGAVLIASFTVLYLIFRPNERKFAKELDALGLKQRVITMYEYQGNDSLMARIQRENAIEHINKVDTKALRFAIPVLLLTLTIAAVVLAASSSTVSALSATGVIKSGSDTIKEIIPGAIKEYDVRYIAGKASENAGTIKGKTEQTVKEGEDASPVIAKSNYGYVFLYWSDGLRNPYRQDFDVKADIEVTAVFVTIDEYIELLKDPGTPVIPPEPASQSSTGDEGDGDGESDLMFEDNSQVIDGDTYYGDSVFDLYKGEAMDSLSGDGDVPDSSKQIVNDYFDNIEQ